MHVLSLRDIMSHDVPLAEPLAPAAARRVVRPRLVALPRQHGADVRRRDVSIGAGAARRHRVEEHVKCADCGTPMVVRRKNRRYDSGGLPHVVLQGVEERRCPACGAEELVIPRIEELHRVIARALIHKPARLAGSEIRFLRKHLGLSSTDLARRMGTTRETVSRWEGGATPIGPLADRLLRVLVATTDPVGDCSVEAFLIGIRRGATPEPTRLTLKPHGTRGWLAGAA